MMPLCVISSALGVFYVLCELILYFQNKTLCYTEGCKVIMGLASNEFFILLIGLILFFSLNILFMINPKKNVFPIIDTILVSALAVEGYLLGIQFFALSQFCEFCLGVFLLISLIAIIYMLSYRRFTTIFGFISFIAVFLGTYLVSPPSLGLSLDHMAFIHYIKGKPNTKWYLFTKKDCPHCEEILHYCLNQYQGDLDLYVCSAQKCSLLLKTLGINTVPVLLIEGNARKEIIVGESCIMERMREKKLAFPELLPFGSAGNACTINQPCQ